MALWGNIEPAANRFIKDINTDELQDRLDQMREQIGSLTRTFRRNAGRHAGWATRLPPTLLMSSKMR